MRSLCGQQSRGEQRSINCETSGEVREVCGDIDCLSRLEATGAQD